MPEPTGNLTRRGLLQNSVRGLCLFGTGAGAVLLARGASRREMVWQIDPHKCTACGNCETHCVLTPSAVKCAHSFEMCGYCKLCFDKDIAVEVIIPIRMPDKMGGPRHKNRSNRGTIVRIAIENSINSFFRSHNHLISSLVARVER